jgi:transcriptional regulator of heat shock response
MAVEESEAHDWRQAALSIMAWALSGLTGYALSSSDANPRFDTISLTWIVLVAIALAATWAIHVMAQGQKEEARRKEERERDERRQELITEAIKALLRQKLVSEHDRLVDHGNANDTQRQSYYHAHQLYKGLCEATHDVNGIVDVYFDDVMSLPNWDGIVRKESK